MLRRTGNLICRKPAYLKLIIVVKAQIFIMKFAFCLFKYFPYGGLQRGFLELAKECISREHQVDVYTCAWSGSIPDDLEVTVLSPNNLTNHRRYVCFAQQMQKHTTTSNYDAVVGFNKMPGLDVYFASDVCYAALIKERSFLYHLTPRCRALLLLEQAVFHPQSSTHIISISDIQMQRYISCYGTPAHRFHPVPPGISSERLQQANMPGVREDLRKEFKISPETKVILMVGSDFRRKGIDRAIKALHALPGPLRDKSLLMVVGQGKEKPLRLLARRLNISSQVFFLGKRDDVPRFLAGADLLLHPARHENTGTVLLEAMGAGLPVLATDTCGYAFHIQKAQAGKTIPAPFRQEVLNEMLSTILLSQQDSLMAENGKRYVHSTDVYRRHEKSASIIEKIAVRKSKKNIF